MVRLHAGLLWFAIVHYGAGIPLLMTELYYLPKVKPHVIPHSAIEIRDGFS